MSEIKLVNYATIVFQYVIFLHSTTLSGHLNEIVVESKCPTLTNGVEVKITASKEYTFLVHINRVVMENNRECLHTFDALHIENQFHKTRPYQIVTLFLFLVTYFRLFLLKSA